MILRFLAVAGNSPPPVLFTPHCGSPSVLFSLPVKRAFKSDIYGYRSWKCSISVVSVSPQLETAETKKPFPAEVSRTIVALASVGTLSTITHEGLPLGLGVRFALDLDGTPIICLNESKKSLSVDKRCSLHVQLDQCGLRMPQCTILGSLEKPGERMALGKLRLAWNKRFSEELDESYIHVFDVERVLQTEDFAENGIWISSSEYASAEPDPLRDCAVKIVDEINALHTEDIRRFCNVFMNLDFQVLDAKIVWVDRLGFDVHLRSVQNEVYEVRIPFQGEVANEKGAKSSFNGMCQLAWEVEKNLYAPDFNKVKALKKIRAIAG